ncbi:MAG TPA: branched-chain amino acid ABC transporter permease [Candidatus Dormibacteraeota bacterium]|jgi:branched-chain amino acid transport system permease protein|nr:branched-chain amino acid ABC transporter permease [Candidatus Dormibacteraeota bacterium]
MRTFLILTVDGVTNGFVYAVVALALVMIWRATRVVNYAQGAMAMFTTYIALFAITHGVTYWLAFVIALGAGFLIGAGVERVLVRPVESRPPLNVVILTLGLLIFLEALAPMLFGGQVKSFPAPFSRNDLTIGTTQLYVSPFDIFVVGAVLLTMVALLLFFQRTTIGLRMRAAAFGPEIARLLGVRVGRMLALGWGLAALLGAMAGLLIAPAIFLYPNNMDEILVFGFTGAVLGGLDSPVGAVVGALLVGLGLSYVGGYAGSDLETMGGLIILIAVLMVRPQGLFAARRQREA